MSKLSGSSLFTAVNAGVSNSYAILSNLYSDGLTQTNLSKALSNNNLLTSQYGTTFASYLTQNFSSLDKNSDGTLSADEVQKYFTAQLLQSFLYLRQFCLFFSYFFHFFVCYLH